MPSQPDITVFIPVRNCERFIGEAIESVLNQTYTDLKLVVSDNASTDGTVEVVRRYMDDPRLVLIERPENIGMVGNCEACLGSLDTPYYMFLCSDDMLLVRNALATAREVLATQDSVRAVYSHILFVDESGQILARRRFRDEGLIDSALLARRSVVSLRNCFGVPILGRSSAARAYQLDDRLSYVGDADMSIATSLGGDIYRIPELTIALRYHDTNATGELHFHAYAQFRLLAAKRRIRLGRCERWRMGMNGCSVPVMKSLFFLYARLRARLRRAYGKP